MISALKFRATIGWLLAAAFLMYILSTLMPLENAFLWFLAINIVSFFSFGRDKLASKIGWRRTPEFTFLTLGFAGGFPGIFVGRKMFRHKTSKLSFVIPMWIVFFTQLGLSAYFLTDFDEKLNNAIESSLQETEAAEQKNTAKP